jgi:hypothetical protein
LHSQLLVYPQALLVVRQCKLYVTGGIVEDCKVVVDDGNFPLIFYCIGAMADGETCLQCPVVVLESVDSLIKVCFGVGKRPYVTCETS